MGKRYGLTFPIPYNKKKGVFDLKKRIKLIGLVLLSCLMVACQPQQSNHSNNQEKNNETTSKKSEGSTSVFDISSRKVNLNSGYDMPLNGIGTYSLTDEECFDSITSALNSGVRLIDTAQAYNNEEDIGRAIKASDVPREDIFITTKLYPNQFDNPESAIDLALEKLDVEYIDLMLLHHPGENDVIPYIQEKGIVVEGWYPFGGRGHTSELLNDSIITEIAKTHDVSSAQVILRWNLQKGVVVIPGSSNPEHIKENTEIYHFELTEDEMNQINKLDRHEKHDWY